MSEKLHGDFAGLLARFNRKERYWLLREAIGAPFATLSPEFLAKFPDEKRPPSSAWWAMDYHFDWIIAAIWLAGRDSGGLGSVDKPRFCKEISGHQEDLDLVIAAGSCVWLCEAKFVGAISKSQHDRKKERLKVLRELVARAELDLNFIDVDILPVGRQDRRRNITLLKKNNIAFDVHRSVEFLTVRRKKMSGDTFDDFEIEPFSV